ncbi:tetratricopeptide repeat protein [Roseivirga sp. BDSF3-8]|uniref:tetratricopeptide repeat protein n=1 Tax=Roseivirga sp. BDSF3-8 TaxID=3241598 RepID=UPI003531F421
MINGLIKASMVLALFFLLSVSITPASAQKRKKSKETPEMKQQEAEYYFVEGEKYFILEDYVKAKVLFERSLELSPDNAAVHYKIAEIFTITEELEKASYHIDKALSLEKNNKYFYLLAADVAGKQGDLGKAIALVEEMMETIDHTEEYYFELAGLYLMKRDFESALSTYEKAGNIFGDSPELLIQKQRLYLQTNQLDEAVRIGKQLVEMYEGEPEFVNALADVLISNERADEAATYLEEYLQEYPEQNQVRLALAEAYRQNGEEEKAGQQMLMALEGDQVPLDTKVQTLAYYLSRMESQEDTELITQIGESLIESHPEEADAWTINGDMYFALNEKQKALHMYKKAIGLDNSNYNVWQNILSIQYELGETDSLINYSEDALEYFPNQANFYFFNGSAHLMSKNYDEAAYSLERGKKLSSSNLDLQSIFNSQLGDVYHFMGNYDKSDMAYEAALDYNPDNDHVLNNYSYYLSLRKDKLDLARKMSAKLVKRNPENPTFLDTHAWVLYVQGDYKGARGFLERAIKADDGSLSGTIIEHYGDVLFKLGETDKAVIQWQKAKGMDDTSDLIDKKIADRKLYE